MNKRKKGNEYESIAIKYLINEGYIILNRNFYTRFGEIDIICKYKGILVFVEVKYRNSLRYGYPGEAITTSKIHSICKSANYYIYKSGIRNMDIRFDCILICGNNISHIENAFNYQI